MNPNFLDFEQPIAELEAKIQELRHASHGQAFNIDDEVHALQDKLPSAPPRSSATSRRGRSRSSRAIRRGRTRSITSA